jgi:plastocyanin
MRFARSLPLSALLGLAACGGTDTPAAGVPQNAFTGAITVSGPMPASTTNCLATSRVVITATGVAPHTVPVAGGDCVEFLNSDTAVHKIAPNTVGGCAELRSTSSISAGNTFTTVPLAGPRTCNWMDSFNPPPAGGGGGGGY